MHIRITKTLSWSIFLSVFTLTSSLSTSPKHASDPSVPDETDINVVDDLLKTIAANKTQNSDPNRGSPLPDPSKDQAVTTTAKTVVTTTPVTLQDGQHCKCVQYTLCNMDGEKSVRNANVQTELKNYMRDNSTASHNTSGTIQCENSFDICCPLMKIKPSNETRQNSSGGDVTTKPVSAAPVVVDSPNDGQRTRCGHRNEKGVDSKMPPVSQNEAQFGEFPWTVAVIQLEKSEDNPNVTIHKYVGGGSLIHPQVVLTVAHNVLGKSRTALKVRLGEWDTQTNDEAYPSQDRLVKKVIIHEQFVLKRLFNDVALIILAEEARFAPNVDTVCLPPVNKTVNFEGQMCYSAGWGKDHFGEEGRFSVIMKKVSVPIISRDKCQTELSKSDKLPGFRLDKSCMCAGTESGDTCKGDGGAALVCSVSDKQHTHYVQVGAVSWGIGCGSQFPSVYSDIGMLTPWIFKQMAKEGFSTEYCTIHD